MLDVAIRDGALTRLRPVLMTALVLPPLYRLVRASAPLRLQRGDPISASQYVVKIVVTTLLVIAISEVSKRSSFIGALLASVPIVSVLAMIWLYTDTRDVAQVAALSRSVFWLVLPSLVLFLLLPILLTRGHDFYASLAASLGATILVYLGAIALGRHLGLEF